uniref:Uncharacterized protein n=1 Tax=Arion vulgaris TaxID=1028688 RepID=A0A0B6ZHA4_9EUPU
MPMLLSFMVIISRQSMTWLNKNGEGIHPMSNSCFDLEALCQMAAVNHLTLKVCI